MIHLNVLAKMDWLKIKMENVFSKLEIDVWMEPIRAMKFKLVWTIEMELSFVNADLSISTDGKKIPYQGNVLQPAQLLTFAKGKKSS